MFFGFRSLIEWPQSYVADGGGLPVLEERVVVLECADAAEAALRGNDSVEEYLLGFADQVDVSAVQYYHDTFELVPVAGGMLAGVSVGQATSGESVAVAQKFYGADSTVEHLEAADEVDCAPSGQFGCRFVVPGAKVGVDGGFAELFATVAGDPQKVESSARGNVADWLTEVGLASDASSATLVGIYPMPCKIADGEELYSVLIESELGLHGFAHESRTQLGGPVTVG